MRIKNYKIENYVLYIISESLPKACMDPLTHIQYKKKGVIKS